MRSIKMGTNIIDYYNGYDEEGRLFRDNAHKTEWMTSMHYFKKLFRMNASILDGCAGTGNYAFPLAKLGYQVTAGDIVPNNVEIIRKKQEKDPALKEIYVGSMTDLSRFADQTFDAVLCMGAFYHVGNGDRILTMKECLRVLKPNGMLVISYINAMAAVVLGLKDELKNMDEVNKWFENKTSDGIFLYMSPSQVEQLANDFQMKIVAHVAADGISHFLSDKINRAAEENFHRWFQFHLKTCEDQNLLGYSLHALLILQK